MVRVLITGGNGYIGLNTATLLRSRGHRVSGTVRKETEANVLARKEVSPIVVELSDGKTLNKEVLDDVSVVIDTVFNYTDSPLFSTNRALLKAVEEASARSVAAGGSKKRYIYISGVLMYGDYKGQVVDESFPPRVQASPRIQFEKLVISSTLVDGAVVRPGWVYGGAEGRYSAGFFKGNAKDEIEVHGNPDKYWGWVHISDLVDALALVTEAPAASVSGQVFDCVDSTRLTFEQLRVLLARYNGVKGPVVRLPAGSDAWSQLCETNAQPKGDKLQRVVGWRPRLGPLQDELATWHAAFKAAGVL